MCADWGQRLWSCDLGKKNKCINEHWMRNSIVSLFAFGGGQSISGSALSGGYKLSGPTKVHSTRCWSEHGTVFQSFSNWYHQSPEHAASGQTNPLKKAPLCRQTASKSWGSCARWSSALNPGGVREWQTLQANYSVTPWNKCLFFFFYNLSHN